MNYNKMTVKQLKSMIREKTKEINITLATNPDLQDKFSVKQAISNLQQLGATGRKGNIIGLGFSNKGRNKASLVRQLKELDYTNPLFENEDGVNYLEEKYQRAYNEFLREHPDVTEEEYRDVVTAFGSVGEDIVKQFDSNQIADIAVAHGKTINIADIMLEVVRENKGKGADVRTNTDAFMRKLLEL